MSDPAAHLMRLTNLIEIKHGFAFASEFFGSLGEFILLTPGNFHETGGYRDLSNAQKRYSGPIPSSFVLKKGDVLIAMTEQSPGLLGSTIKVPQNGIYLHNQRLGLLIIQKPDLVCPNYLYHVFNAPHVRKEISSTSSGTKVKHTSPTKLSAIEVFLPPIEEQQKVAAILDEWDSAIQKTEQLVAAKVRRLRHFRNTLLRSPGRASRFKLHAVTQELTRRNGNTLGREAIMAVTRQVGMRPMRGETIAANIERYKLVPPRAFAYNPMRLNIGSIAMSRFDSDVLVSPDYVVFACDESRLLPGYLHHLRFSQSWRNHLNLAGNGSVRVRIYYDDLGTFSFDLPSTEVQAGIIRYLDAAERDIKLLNQQIETLREQKRGLMRKLLTGQWRLPLPQSAPESEPA